VLSELAVVLSFDFVGLAAATLLARWTLRRPPSGGEAKRLVNAATRASESFLWREAKYAALPTIAGMVVIVVAHALFVARKIPGRTFETALWTGFATLLGSLMASSVAYVATQMGLRASLRTLRAAHSSLNQATAVALRGAGVTALAAEGLGAAAVASLLGLEYLLGGGAVAGTDKAADLLQRAGAILPGLCLGSVAASSVFGLGGASYHVSAEIGGLSAAGLEPTDPRNPSMVADLVGDHVGLGARRAVDMFTATTLANVTAVLLGIVAFRADGGASGARAWGFVTLPLVVRAVGVLASALGLMTARATDAERTATALWRGQTTTFAVVLGGLLGAAFWLIGIPGFQWLVAAGAAGVAAGTTTAQIARLRAVRRQAAVAEVLEAARAGSGVAMARGLAHGLEGTLPTIALLGLMLPLSYHLGTRTPFPSGGLLGVAVALSSFTAASPYMLAVGLFGPIVGGAATVTVLDPEKSDTDTRRRGALLEEAGSEGGAAAQAFSVALGCSAALVAGLWASLGHTSGGATETWIANPVVACSGLFGAALVASVCGRCLSAAARAARGTAMEVERQLRGFPREGGIAVIPEGYTPSYRTVVELVYGHALQGTIFPIFLGFAAPAALGIALRLLYTSSGLAAEGLTSFVVFAAATGLGTALANDGSRGVLGAAHRANRARGGGTGSEATLASQALGAFSAEIVAPAAHVFVTATATTALLIAPLLSA
jgi:Na+/H+-translocating membrane pyrophosphatase